jgi:TolA-binding protein
MVLDLKLAAEIGRNLVNANETLKRKYDALLRHSRRSGKLRPARFNSDEEEEEETTAVHTRTPSGALTSAPMTRGPSHALSDHEDDKRYPNMLSTTSGNVASSRYDADRVRELEEQNAELHSRVDTVQVELEFAQKSAARRAKKLDAELSNTKRDLERASERITELEKELDEKKGYLSNAASPDHRALVVRGRASPLKGMARGRSKNGGLDVDGDVEELDTFALKRKVAELEAAHNAVMGSKRIVNERLAATQNELRSTKSRVADLESRVRALAHFEQAYERQTARVEQLEHALEEQRRYVTGDFTPAMTPAAVRSPELSPDHYKKHESIIQQEFDRGRSLMDELEMVLFKANQLSGSPSGMDRLFDAPGQAKEPVYAAPLGQGYFLSEFVGSVGQAAGGSMNPLSQGAGVPSLLLDQDKSFFGLLRGVLMGMYKWFRFMMLLWAAIMVTVYRGPKQRIKAAGKEE